MNRNESFGSKKISLLDKIIYALRVHQLKKYCDFDDKIIVDAGCGHNAIFLNYIKKRFAPKKLIAFDLKLNEATLKEQ
jgi:hypothetical protein